MKKVISIILSTVMMLMISTSVFAANGDVAGYIYYTDIKTIMYSAPINALNIGGRTVIDAEALNWHYGFDVYWLSEERKLEIVDKGRIFVSGQAANGETLEEMKGKPGDVAGKYFYTDIKTYLNGKEIESYNIGGRTFIVAEAMRDYGYNVIWNEEDRTLSVKKNKNIYTVKTEIGDVNLWYYPTHKNGDIFAYECKRSVTIDYNTGTMYELMTPSNSIMENRSGVSYIALSDLVQVFNANCLLREHVQNANGNERSYHQIDFNFDTTIKPELKEKTTYDFERTQMNLSASKYEEIGYDDIPIYINGKYIGVPAMYGGNTFQSNVIVIDGKIYVPTQIISHLLDCYSAF